MTPSTVKHEDQPQQAGSGCLVRLVWMVFGNIALVIAVVSILRKQELAFSIADVALWAIVGVMVAARWLDVTRLNGLTAAGRRATLADWRRYAMLLTGGALALWALGHGWVWMK